jgi:hypothetical protein
LKYGTSPHPYPATHRKTCRGWPGGGAGWYGLANQNPYAAQAGEFWRLRCWMIGALCERMLASASGNAVEQKAHSADTRPINQWVRPQPGQ